MAVHPEFKQKEESKNVEITDKDGNNREVETHYLRVTMPEVDDDRYDVLKQAANAMYEECKVQMESAKTQVEGQIAILAVDEKPEDMDKVKNAIKELNKTWTEKRDQLHEDKLKEIEDAHNKYLQEQAETAQKQKEEQLAAGDGGKSLDLSQLQG